MRAQTSAFVADRWRVPKEQVQVTVRPIAGGLESAVGRARVRSVPGDASIPRRLVVKELRGRACREAEVYDLLWQHLEHPPAARVFGSNTAGDTRYLFLEDVECPSDWPWRDVAVPMAVCRALANLHDATSLRAGVGFWDYETELAQSAHDTLALATAPHPAHVWQPTGELKRVVAALHEIRATLLAGETTVIHGDVHPGNVMIRPNECRVEVTFIDWGRTRVGSPLEDVASWLHSLGCWEPEARRRHDTLLRGYLENRRAPEPLTVDLRKRYWFASVSNGLAGAIRYHIAVLRDPASNDLLRANSRQALHAWQRVVRRAAALLPANPSHRSAGARPGRRLPTSPR